MAKTESTAVNALIELVQSGNGTPDGAEELFATPPKKVSAPRMTGTVPPIAGAGEVAPLPRRVPTGTQQVPVAGSQTVRVSTAPPARAASIPPIPQPSAAEPDDSMIKTTPSLGPVVREAQQMAAPNPKATLLGSGHIDRSQLPPLPPPNPKATLLGSGSAQIDRSQLPPLPAAVGTSTIMGHASAIDPTQLPAPRATLPPPRPSAQLAAQRPSGSLPPPTPAIRPSAPPIPSTPPIPTVAHQASPFGVPVAPPPAPTPIAAPPLAPPMPYPSAQPYMHLAPDMTSNQAWFDEAAVDAMEPIEHEIGTAQISKSSSWKTILPKLIMPMVVLVIVGIFVGGYFAFDGDGGQKAKTAKVVAPKAEQAVAPAAEAKAEPAAVKDETKAEPAVAETTTEPAKTEEPVAKTEPAKTEEPKTEPAQGKTEEPKADVKPEPTAKTEQAVTPPNLVGTTNEPAKTAGRPAFVDVKIESEPSKATVMIVDRGKTSFLGPTPIVASLDPSREYDIVFTYPNKPTQLEHIAPAKSNHLKVKLGKQGNQATAAKKTEVKVVAKTEKPKTEVKVVKTEKPKTEVKVEKPKKAEIVDAFETKPPAPAGEGVLMISSKPPCEIVIDGVPSGLTTPQRAIKLAAGKHKITLVNTAEKIKKTIAVEITADQPTKVIQDLMAK